MKTIKTKIFLALAWIAMPPTVNAQISEVVAKGTVVKLNQISEHHGIVGSVSRDGVSSRLVIGATIDKNGVESRSLIEFGPKEIVAFNFESKSGNKIVTHQFNNSRIDGGKFEITEGKCEVTFHQARYKIENQTIIAEYLAAPVKYCIEKNAIHQEITGNEDRESVNHVIFKPDLSVATFGKAYRDPKNLIWSRAQLSSNGEFVYQTFARAEQHCANLGARLPNLTEVERLKEAFTDYDNPYYPVYGGTIYPTKPYTKKSLEKESRWYANLGEVPYDGKVSEVIPNISFGDRRTHYVYTSDKNFVWYPSAGYNYVIPTPDFFYAATICVTEKK